MKKLFSLLIIPTTTLSLSSCTINWFGGTMDVPWYYVVIPVVMIAVCGYFILMSKTYICPDCGTEFKAKPYHLFVTIHMGRKRIAKCPKCGRKGFCNIKR